MYRSRGADGIKTGYLSVEKYSLASSIQNGTRRLISVGSGFESKISRTTESIKLLSWGFRNTETFQVSKVGESFYNVKTWLGKEDFVKAGTKEDIYITLGKKDSRYFKTILEYSGPINAPIKKDQEIATLKIYKKDELIKSVPLYALDDIKKINFIKSFFTSINYMIWGDV